MCLKRNGRVEDEREPVAVEACALVVDRGGDALRAQSDVGVVSLRSRDRQHQRRRVAEVLNKVDWTSAIRQIVNAVELQLDIVKLFAGLFEVLVELDVDDRGARTRDRFNLRDLR